MKLNRKFFKNWVLIPIGMGLSFYGTIRLINDVPTRMRFWERPWETTASEVLGGIAITYILLIGIHFFTKKFNKKTFKDTKKQIAYEVRTIAIFTLITINILGNTLSAITDNGIQAHDPIILNVVVLSLCLLLFIYRRANYYLKAYSENKIKVEKLAREKVETELKFLKSQINPHFLFNAINNIYHLIKDDKDQAQRALDEFSQMLRYQLYECNGESVSLEREINYISNYIALQKMRYSDKLQVAIDFPQKTSEERIAPFLFLPLVENAFKYVGEGYWIQFHLAQQPNWIKFKVANACDEGYKALNEQNGIGLENLSRRLELLYPDQHRLEVKRDEKQFEVTLKVKTA